MDKIDELFSPERLRANWKKATNGNDQKVDSAPQIIGYLQILHEVSVLVERRFSGDDALVLDLLLGDLNRLFKQKYPLAETLNTRIDENSTDEIDAVDVQIAQVINQVEDLVDAFEIKK